MATGPREMLIDGFLPAFAATIIAHIVIDASPAAAYEAARAMDFMEIHSPLVDAIMTVRDLPSRVASGLGRGRPSRSQPHRCRRGPAIHADRYTRRNPDTSRQRVA